MLDAIESTPTHLLVFGGVLTFLLLVFITFFLLPAISHWFRLHRIQSVLGKFEEKTLPIEFKKLFTKDKQLAHLWSEYSESLHEQFEENDGQMVIVAVRSTIPADFYFSDQFVVDSRLRTEFFKHLPGIFTGVGIIGTFYGLIQGLSQFQVSEDAVAVRVSLESLMHSVGEAFLISAAAITAAMVVTFLEKLLLASLYRHTEKIAHTIDSHFDSGAGEEYLSRLVTASEDSASQSKILKDALVRDLGELLREISHHQVEAIRQDNKSLGDTIATSIRESLKGPLEEIAGTVKTASGDQSSAAISMLNDVMISFSQRLNDLFGGQISGINDLNKQTIQGVQDAVRALNSLVTQLEETGRKSTDDMTAQIAGAIKSMEERQSSINTQTQVFVDQISKLIESSQTQTQEKLRTTLEAIGQQMFNILGTLSESQRQVFEENREREEVFSGRAEDMISGMSGTIEIAAKEMAAASKAMAESVILLSANTSTSIDKLSAGVDRLNTAATNFATAGDRVTNAMMKAEAVSLKLTEVSGALSTGAGAVQDALRDYRTQREAMSSLLSDVRATVELAKREASITADVLQRIESSTLKLGEAQKDVDEYLEGVSHVLAESTEEFRESVVKTLGHVNYEFHEKLKNAVALLSSSISELDTTLGSVTPRR